MNRLDKKYKKTKKVSCRISFGIRCCLQTEKKNPLEIPESIKEKKKPKIRRRLNLYISFDILDSPLLPSPLPGNKSRNAIFPHFYTRRIHSILLFTVFAVTIITINNNINNIIWKQAIVTSVSNRVIRTRTPFFGPSTPLSLSGQKEN